MYLSKKYKKISENLILKVILNLQMKVTQSQNFYQLKFANLFLKKWILL